MNARTFFEKVTLMRQAQREYFKTRAKDYLVKSKTLEQEIDNEIARVRSLGYQQTTVAADSVGGQTKQASLF